MGEETLIQKCFFPYCIFIKGYSQCLLDDVTALQVNAMTTSFNKPYFVSEKSGLVRTTTPISDWMFLAEKSWLTSNFRILSKTRHVNAVFKLLYW